jgi:hypothetical protein
MQLRLGGRKLMASINQNQFVDPTQLIALHTKNIYGDMEATCLNCDRLRWSYNPERAKHLFHNKAIEMPVCGCCGYYAPTQELSKDSKASSDGQENSNLSNSANIEPSTGKASGKFELAKGYLCPLGFILREEIQERLTKDSNQENQDEAITATLIILNKTGSEKLGEISYLPDFGGFYATLGRGFPEKAKVLGELQAVEHWLLWYQDDKALEAV